MLTISSAVCGYHICKDIWEAGIQNSLVHEDCYAMYSSVPGPLAVMNGTNILGHIVHYIYKLLLDHHNYKTKHILLFVLAVLQ